MTTKEHIAIQKFMNKLTILNQEADDAFTKLQKLNKEEGSGKAWCCAEENYRDLLKCGKNYGYVYNKYVSAEAKKDLLREYGSMLADLGFWNRYNKERR